MLRILRYIKINFTMLPHVRYWYRQAQVRHSHRAKNGRIGIRSEPLEIPRGTGASREQFRKTWINAPIYTSLLLVRV